MQNKSVNGPVTLSTVSKIGKYKKKAKTEEKKKTAFVMISLNILLLTFSIIDFR